jgi:hypothetical protein
MMGVVTVGNADAGIKKLPIICVPLHAAFIVAMIL